MKKLDKLIIKSFIGPFIVTFFITLFVLVLQFFWKYIDDLVGKGLDTFTIVKLTGYVAATAVPLALPLAVLLSSIMTMGNLGESFETIAVKSAGIASVRLVAVGYADTRNIVPNLTPEGRVRNRRVTVMILPERARHRASVPASTAPTEPPQIP